MSWNGTSWAGSNDPSSCGSFIDLPIGSKYIRSNGVDYVKTGASGTNTWDIYPTAATINAGIQEATNVAKGTVILAGDLSGTYNSPTVVSTNLASPLSLLQGGTGSSTQNFVDLTTAQSLAGIKTFLVSPVLPTPTVGDNSTNAATTAYVETELNLIDSLNIAAGKLSPSDIGASGGTTGQVLMLNASGAWRPKTVTQELEYNVNVPVSTTALADVTGVTFPVASGIEYWFKFTIRYTAALVGTGAFFSINGPTLTSTTFKTIVPQSTTLDISRSLVAYNTGAFTTGSANTTGNIATVEGFIQCSAAGNVQLRLGSETAGSAITVTDVHVEYKVH
jgi:hypothetical protein